MSRSGTPKPACGSSSDMRCHAKCPSGRGLRNARSLVLFALLLIVVGCGSTSKGTPSSTSSASEQSSGQRSEQGSQQGSDRDDNVASGRTATPAPRPEIPGYPEEALDLLTQSTRDSCSICAEKNRKKAFAVLDEFYPPETILASNEGRRLERMPDGLLELRFNDYDREQPRLTFRFHTGAEHLIGIEPADYTDAAIAAEVDAPPQGSASTVTFSGAIRIVPFAYGDGPSYLYSPSENHLQIQCQVLDLARN